MLNNALQFIVDAICNIIKNIRQVLRYASMLKYKLYKFGVYQFHLDSPSPCPLILTRVVLEDVVHLFQRPPFGLWYKEESPDTGEYAEDGKEDVCAVASILDKGWGNETLGAN